MQSRTGRHLDASDFGAAWCERPDWMLHRSEDTLVTKEALVRIKAAAEMKPPARRGWTFCSRMPELLADGGHLDG